MTLHHVKISWARMFMKGKKNGCRKNDLLYFYLHLDTRQVSQHCVDVHINTKSAGQGLNLQVSGQFRSRRHKVETNNAHKWAEERACSVPSAVAEGKNCQYLLSAIKSISDTNAGWQQSCVSVFPECSLVQWLPGVISVSKICSRNHLTVSPNKV